MWKVVEPAIDFVLDLQQPRGEILWARHPDGTPWSFALLTGSSSIAHSLRCAVAIAEELHHERPDWELSVGLLAHAIRHERDEAFSPKHRWAMDWYYPVLAGVITGEAGRTHLAERFDTFMLDDKGIRCVSDRPWVTTAETCECALAHLGVGEHDIAMQLFRASQATREDDGRYITGIVHPDGTSSLPTSARPTPPPPSSSPPTPSTAPAPGSSPTTASSGDHRRRPGQQRRPALDERARD